jgi:hypothetical protein
MTSLLNNYCLHFYSYGMNLRPTIIYDDPPMENPVEELPLAISTSSVNLDLDRQTLGRM